MESSAGEFFHDTQKLFDWEAFFKRALSKGGEWADLYWEKAQRNQLRIVNSIPSEASCGQDEGIGLRVLHEGRTIYRHTNDLSPEGLEDLANQVAREVNAQKKDFSYSAFREHYDPILGLDLPANEVSTLEKSSWLMKLAQSLPQSLKNSQASSSHELLLIDRRKKFFVARSDGLVVCDERSQLALELSQQAFRDTHAYSINTQWGGHWGWNTFSDNFLAEIVSNTKTSLEAQSESIAAPHGSMPIVLSSHAGGVLLSKIIARGLEADLAANALSSFSGAIGTKIASEKLSLFDDGRLPHGAGSQHVDDEGHFTQKTLLIENGVLRNFLYDHRSALKNKTKSTGNGRRQSYKYQASVRLTNLVVQAGSKSENEMIASIPRGLYVKKLGGGQVSGITGDYIFSIEEAYLIDKGIIGRCVHGASLVGKAKHFLSSIVEVASESQLNYGICDKMGQPLPIGRQQPALQLADQRIVREL
jgi:TldD protein